MSNKVLQNKYSKELGERHNGESTEQSYSYSLSHGKMTARRVSRALAMFREMPLSKRRHVPLESRNCKSELE